MAIAEKIQSTEETIQLSPLEISERIASTNTSNVYRAHSPLAGIALALKVAKPSSFAEYCLRNEARTTPQIPSEHILPVIGEGTIQQAATNWLPLAYLVSLFSEEGTLRDLIVDDVETANTALTIIKDAALGLIDMHEKGYVHCDVKDSNIYVANTDQGFVGDLGITVRIGRPVNNGNSPGRTFGSIPYLSPEQITAQPMNAGSDAFSLGVTAIHAITGLYPWKKFNDARNADQQSLVRVYDKTLNYGEFEEYKPDFVPSELLEMLRQFINRSASDRPPIEEFLDLPLI